MKISPAHFRDFIFGVEDSLVSTVGLISGVAAAGLSTATVVIAGVVLIFVEAFSMAVGTLLSENSAQEFAAHREVPLRGAFDGGLIMFSSYFVSGFIPLSPYVVFSVEKALVFSAILSLATLFALGAAKAKLANIGIIRNGTEMLLLGGIAIGIGIAVGRLLSA